MTTKIFIATIFILTLASCDNNRKQDKAKLETPKALEDKNTSYEIGSKRGYDDLVESLYNELLCKNAELKQLENEIDELKNSKADTTNAFDKFNGKSQLYFASAIRDISEIKDTLLRDKMKVLVASNSTKYNSLIAGHTDLLKVIGANNLAISDLHNVLKIIKTLPLIEKYQRDNLPGTKSLEG